MEFNLFAKVAQVQIMTKECRGDEDKVKCMFSIREKYKRRVDNLSCLPVTFRTTRSQVIETAVEHFSKLSKQHQIDLLQKMKEGK